VNHKLVLKIRRESLTTNLLVGSKLSLKLVEYLRKEKIRKCYILSDLRLKKESIKIATLIRKNHLECHEISIKVSEEAKSYQNIFKIYTELLKNKADRRSVIIALGGGVTGDIAGFIAGTYMRGMAWIGIPTTLLAMVDSSVGGKTGVNHPLGKNLIGMIHQPKLVLCDIDYLKTLEQRDIYSGYAEMIKIALALDKKYFKLLAENENKITKRDISFLCRAISRSLELKMDIVSRDEFERKGIRDILNFGHTIGHALETITSYKRFRHGEAVLWGMRIESALSFVRGYLSRKEFLEIERFLSSIPCPALPLFDLNEFMDLLTRDKKTHDGRTRFVLLRRIGLTLKDSDVTREDIKQALTLQRFVS